MKELNEFMLLFRFNPAGAAPTAEQLQEMSKQWGEFIGTIAMQGRLVSTHQLGFEGKTISPNFEVGDGFHISDNVVVAGNMVLKAESLEVATELGKNCPILYMGGTVEVRDINPMN